jgi:hypothetical protein
MLSQALPFLITSLLLNLVNMPSESNQSSGIQTYSPDDKVGKGKAIA